MGNANIERGKKWATERAKAVFEQRNKDVEWIDSQKSITNDIAEYENSISKKEPEKPVEAEDSKPKGKAKKAPVGA